MQGETEKVGVWYRDGNFFYMLRYYAWPKGNKQLCNAAEIRTTDHAIADKIWIMLQKENQDAG